MEQQMLDAAAAANASTNSTGESGATGDFIDMFLG